MKNSKSRNKTTVFHGQIIDTVEWGHQIVETWMHRKGAVDFVCGNECSLEDFNKMPPGKIMIFARSDGINGIAKDDENNYRYLKTPTQIE